MSTMYAESRHEPIIRAQHHHAHVVSAMAEHHLDGPVIGLAYDGTGYGFDGTIWGGEVLLATPASFERLATFRPLALVGGDAAVHEPWRGAPAMVLDAYDGELPEAVAGMMASVSADELARMASLVRRNVQGQPCERRRPPLRRVRCVVPESSPGGVRRSDRTRVEPGGVAVCVAPLPLRASAISVDPVEIDLRPAVREAIAERGAGVAVGDIAAAFHDTLAAATAEAVRRSMERVGRLPIVASGGCFLNARLAESVCTALSGFDVRLHALVPPGDGGIALVKLWSPTHEWRSVVDERRGQERSEPCA